MKNKILTIPNYITFSRLPFAILVVLNTNSDIKYVFIILAIASDFFDGFVARKLHQESKFGAVLDAVLDKIITVGLFFFFFMKLNLDIYLIPMFLIRDILVSVFILILSIIKFTTKVEIKARILGKVVTVFQFAVLLSMVAGYNEITLIGIYIVFCASIFAVIDYCLYVNRLVRKG